MRPTRSDEGLSYHHPTHTSSIRLSPHTNGIPSRRQVMIHQPQHTEPIVRFHVHPMFWIGGFFVIAVFGYMILSVLFNWAQMWRDDQDYGRPRTYQTDKDVGHGGKSHFTVQNLQGHIFVTEIINLDGSKTSTYIGPRLQGGGVELIPAELTFEDANGDGKLDMMIVVQGTKYPFLNQDGGFKGAL